MEPKDMSTSELYELVKDTNKRVKRIERKERWRSIGSIFKYLVYIAIAVGTYYYVQPYIAQVGQIYQQVQEAASGIKDIKSSASGGLSALLEQFKN